MLLASKTYSIRLAAAAAATSPTARRHPYHAACGLHSTLINVLKQHNFITQQQLAQQQLHAAVLLEYSSSAGGCLQHPTPPKPPCSVPHRCPPANTPLYCCRPTRIYGGFQVAGRSSLGLTKPGR
jgi:hypothetical protein